MNNSEGVPSSEICAVLRQSADFLLGPALTKKGLVRAMYYFKTGKWQEKIKPDDFGDYSPFIVATSRLVDDPAYSQKVKDLLLRFKQHTFDGLFHSKEKGLPVHFFTSKIRDNDDMLEGLLQNFRLTADPLYLETAVVLAKNIIQKLYRNELFCERSFCGFILPRRFYILFRSTPSYSLKEINAIAACDSNGFFIENFLHLYHLTGDEQFLLVAQSCMQRWISTVTFQEFGLFPDAINSYTRKESPVCTAMKQNSHMGFSLLALMKEKNGEKYSIAFDKWYEGMVKHLGRTGGFASNYNTRTKKTHPKATLTQNHGLFDVRLRRFQMTNSQELLKSIEQDLGLWVATQSKIGIFSGVYPDSVDEKRVISSDTQGDFLNVLMKHYTITKNPQFLPAIHKGVSALIKYFFKNGYWYEDVYSEKGEVAKDTLLTKFCGGSMKCLVLYESLFNQRSAFDHDLLWSIVDDR